MLITAVLRGVTRFFAAALTPSGAVAPKGAGERPYVIADMPDSSAQGGF